MKKFIFFVIIVLNLNITHINAYSDTQVGKNQVSGQAESKNGSGYNVIIVCLDTLRADHVGCYGYPKDTTPNIDKLSKIGIIFEWAFAQSNFTLSSHASLFTSKYVHSHKVDRIERRLSDKETTLAEVLKENGYKTGAFIYNAQQFNPVFGLGQGFDTYSFGVEDNSEPSFIKTLPQALGWIKQNKDKKFFVFLHSNDIHEPYHSPFENFFDPGYKGPVDNQYLAWGNRSFHKDNLTRPVRDIEHIIAHYDGGIKYADTFIGELIQQLKDWSLLDKTIIILLSDHGEILADRGMRFYHGFSLHDEEVRVPLIIAHPGIKKAGLRIKNQVQLIDVMPTVLDFLGIRRDNLALEGRSMAGIIEGRREADSKYVYAECISGESEKEGVINRQVMVRAPFWKLISSVWKIRSDIRKTLPRTISMYNGAIISLPQEDGYELYDLKEDPKETKNLIKEGYKNNERELLDELLSSFDIAGD